MTLTTRLSVFFLALLGLVLVGFSTTLYLLARTYLQRQAEDRLHAAMNTLVAAVEISPDYVEWEPTQRDLTFGAGVPGDPLLWVVSDEQGRVVDRSGVPGTDDLLAEVLDRLKHDRHTSRKVEWQGERWQVSQRWVYPSAETKRAIREPGDKKHTAFAITAGVPLGPSRATLRLLTTTLVAVSAGVWLVAMALGRVVCRRALIPVTQMAASARDMNASDLAQRLPVPATGDELEDLSRSFNGLLERMHESFERQRRFTGDSSHQLRTPLTALLGQIDVSLRRDREALEYRDTLFKVQKQALHLQRILEALLFLTRADAEAHVPERESIILSDWLTIHLRSWSEHPRFGDIKIQQVPDDRLEVAAQAALLGELFNILIENACKYSERGSPITVRLDREDGKGLLSVQDRGSGIAAEDLPRVTEPFFRSADARRRGIGGLGLGLAIAKRIAEAFGGGLSIQSKEGLGSCFTLWLPIATADAAR